MSCSCNSCDGESSLNVILEARLSFAECGSYPCGSFTFTTIQAWADYITNCLSCGTLYEYGGIISQNFADSDGDIYSLGEQTEGEWRIKFNPPITCYLKVWIETRTEVFEAGLPDWDPPIAGSVATVGSTYEWVGTGNPCITLPDDDGFGGSNFEYSTPVVEGVPGARTQVCVRMVKYSFLPDYEPDISDPLNPQPSGYPNPMWEPLPP